MAYTIYNNDGSILLTLADGQIDDISTSLTLIGKNVSSYGQYFNNDLIKLMGHFAGPNEPTSPIIGQLWYDTSEGRVKVYDLTQIFRPITSTIAGPSIPVNLVPNDFWYDTTNQQLYYSESGLTNPVLVGPKDSALYGNTGWITETVLDSGQASHVVNKLYNGGDLVGILSESAFTLNVSTAGFTTVAVGLNLNPTIPGIRFVGTATSADAIAGINVNQFLRNDQTQTIQGSFTVAGSQFNVINSTDDQITIYSDPNTHVGTIQYGSSRNPLRLQVTTNLGLATAVYMESANKNVGIWTESPQYPLDVAGDTRIQGNLIVQGTLTNVTSQNLEINSSTIQLGYGQITPSDAYANGGGIELYGATPHKLSWLNDGTGWNSNDNFNLTSNSSTYKISGTTVLTQTGLGIAITSATGLTSIGTLTNLSVGSLYLSTNTIYSTGTIAISTTATLSMNGSRISNLGTPQDNNDAATKEFVINSFYLSHANALSLTLDVTNFSTQFASVDIGVKYYLDLMFPVTNPSADSQFDLPDGSRAKVLYATINVPAPSYTVNVGFSSITAVESVNFYNSTTVTAPAVSGLTGAIAASTTPQTFTPVTSYAVHTWKVEAGVWTKIS